MPTDFAAMIAIDWADQKHAWAMQAGTYELETGAIDHTPEAIDVWLLNCGCGSEDSLSP